MSFCKLTFMGLPFRRAPWPRSAEKSSFHDLAVHVSHEVNGALERDTFNILAVFPQVFSGPKDYFGGFVPEAISHGMRLKRHFR